MLRLKEGLKVSQAWTLTMRFLRYLMQVCSTTQYGTHLLIGYLYEYHGTWREEQLVP